VVRVASLGDVRPAREALVAGGIAADALEGFPAVVTATLDDQRLPELEALLHRGSVNASSIIALWEDIKIPAATIPDNMPISSVISTPA